MHQVVPFEPRYHQGILAVVQDVHREYRFSWDADGYHRDLYNIETTYLAPGGKFWALLNDGQVVGCAGVTLHDRQHSAHDPQGSQPIENDAALVYCELHRLYLLSGHRGKGFGKELLDLSMAFGRQKGARRMIAWSDTILKDAHALYGRNGFVQEGTRICDDPDKSREYGFWRQPL